VAGYLDVAGVVGIPTGMYQGNGIGGETDWRKQLEASERKKWCVRRPSSRHARRVESRLSKRNTLLWIDETHWGGFEIW
jgi:hypothetical protein